MDHEHVYCTYNGYEQKVTWKKYTKEENPHKCSLCKLEINKDEKGYYESPKNKKFHKKCCYSGDSHLREIIQFKGEIEELEKKLKLCQSSPIEYDIANEKYK